MIGHLVPQYTICIVPVLSRYRDLHKSKKDGEIFCLKLGLDVRGLSSHNDLHKNKGHKSVLVRENMSKSPPSVMVAFGKTVIFHHHEQG